MRPFFYSNKIAPTLARHLAFWIAYFLGILLTDLPDIGNWIHPGLATFTQAFKDAIDYLPLFALAVYSAIYLVLPIYLKKRRLSLLLGYWFVLIAITVPLGYLITKAGNSQQEPNSDIMETLASAMHICLGNITALMVVAVCIKIMKDYWLRQRENELLAIENVRNKLHLLKMQLHPRILFASLQRIHLEIELGTREAPEMILKLSDLLSYLLYDSEAEKVPLIKEVQMIENYLALKKLENTHHPDIRFDTSGDFHKHWISPGFFLPLLETGIERGNAICQTPPAAIHVQFKGIGPMIMFSLKTNVPGKALAKDPAIQKAIWMAKERLRDAELQRWKLDVLSDATSTTIVMQLEKPKTGISSPLLKTTHS